MKVERVTLFKLEQVAHYEGVLTLLDNQGHDVESVMVNFEGNQHANLGQATKYLVQRAAALGV